MAARMPGVQSRRFHAGAGRASAHLVQGRERVITIEGRVLEALRHHGAGQLLQAQDELAPLGWRHVAIGGLPSSTSDIRNRVPGVVSSGNAAASKNPHATISWFGSGNRSWRKCLTT